MNKISYWAAAVLTVLVGAGCWSDDGPAPPPLDTRTHFVVAGAGTLTPTADKDRYLLVVDDVPADLPWFSWAVAGAGVAGRIAASEYFGGAWSAAYGTAPPHALVQLFGATPQLDSSWYAAITERSYDADARRLTLRLTLLNTVWYTGPAVRSTSRSTMLTVFDNAADQPRASAFVQHAVTARFAPTAEAGVYTLNLTGVAPISSFVTKAPRIRSHFSPVDVIARQWSTRFGATTPRAALHGGAAGARVQMMAIGEPVFDAASDSLAYTVRLAAAPPEPLSDAVLVVDASEAQFAAGEYPYAAGCAKLDAAAWSTTSLAELTYGCIPAGWSAFFGDPQVKAQVTAVSQALAGQAPSADAISPPIARTFRALYMTSPDEIKALVLGQDPAPTPGLATGLSFSLDPSENTAAVPSVQRVLLELRNEQFRTDVANGDLTTWAEDGVLLLNTALTIPCPAGASSCTIGGHIPLWQPFTAQLVQYIDAHAQPMSYILWGSAAGQYASYAKNPQHAVLKGGHPSPQAAGQYFFCKAYFSCANTWLRGAGRGAINWNLVSAPNPTKEVCVWGWDSATRSSYCAESCAMAACPFGAAP